LDQLPQVLVASLSQGGIYALVGLGFSLVNMASRILNLAQGSYALIGGFIFLSLVTDHGVSIPLALGIVLVLSACLGVLTERIVNLRTKPWQPADLDMAILSTLALYVVCEGGAFLIWGADPRRGPAIQGGVFRVFGTLVVWQSVWMIVTAFAITLGLHLFLKWTWMGRAMRACAQNPTMSHLLGINVRRVGAVAFALSAMMGAVAGVLVSPITWLDYQIGGFFMLNGILAYLIGGEDKVAGPLVGGLLLGFVQNAFLILPGTAGGLLKQVVPMLVLIAMLVWRPQGILAARRT
jgi:branched-subunit amino acid ABC-type transport system permease component